MKIYIASSWSNKEVVQKISKRLREAGFETTHRWPTQHEDHPVEKAAIEDIEDIDRADLVLLYNFGKPSTTGGMHFETGYAFATSKVVLVGEPGPNVFHSLLEHYPTLDHFIEAYQNMEEESRVS